MGNVLSSGYLVMCCVWHLRKRIPDDTLTVILSSSDELGSSGVHPVLSESPENLGLQILFLKEFYIYYL